MKFLGKFNRQIPAYFFLLFYFISSAQNTRLDSIANYYNQKAWDLYSQQNDSCLYYADLGISFSRKNNLKKGEVLNLEVKGVYLEEVKNNYSNASKQYFKAIEIAEEHYKKYISPLYNNLCIMYIATKDYEKAELYGTKSVENSKIIKGTRAEAKAYVNLGIAQSLLKKYNDAKNTFDYFLKLPVLTQFERNIANLRIAKNYKEQKQFKKAQPLFLKVVSLDSLKGQREYNLDYAQLIENSILLNDRKTILNFLEPYKKSFKNEKSLEYLDNFYETMVKISIFLNEPKNALDYQNKSIKLKDSLNTRKYNIQVAELETQYQTKKKEEQIVEEQSKKELWSYISILAFIILGVVGILLFKNSQKRKLLNANKIELEKLLNQRNMLLRETHHRVKNSFQMVSSLLQLQAQGSEAEAAVTALNNAVERVNSMIVLHQQLYAKDNLLGVDLKIYINDLINEILGSYASENINIKADISSTILDIDTATSIGLLVNELATNSIKYAWKKDAKEKNINLEITETNNKISFKMFDNGIAKKVKSIKQNYGSELIEILIERLEATKQELVGNDYGLALTFSKVTNAA